MTKKDPVNGTTKRDGRGKHRRSSVTDECRMRVIEHITSFPFIDSHYCRAKTNKHYLEAGLNIEKMYHLYEEEASTKGYNAFKSSYYRYILNTNFNISFHKPKSDRCDRCEELKVKKQQNIPMTKEEQVLYEKHLSEKVLMREEKKRDKENTTSTSCLVVFDLENVITLPKADVSSFFYKRKLTLYNLTAITNLRHGYCAIWTEITAGRAGNDIASAFISILKQIIKDNPDVVDLLCWSDSCVPQNRNSHISQATLEFLQKNQSINSITMTYSLPGHSCVQEVDNMHKQIEDAMQVAEFYSPISFLRLLLKVNRQAPYRVIQMVENNFKDYMNSSKLLQFNLVPYQKVFQLTFSQNLHRVEFKLSHGDKEFLSANIGRHATTRNRPNSIDRHPLEIATRESFKIVDSRKRTRDKELSKEKKAHLVSMLKYMPLADRDYYKSIGITEKRK